jgi:anti-anti-sigma factor
MQISKLRQGEFVEVSLAGRLDESWTSHLDDALNDVIREGGHRIRLNMSSVTYLSSAGIRILVRFYKQLNEIQGSFAVVQPSQMVQQILDTTRLSPILISTQADSQAASLPGLKKTRTIQHQRGSFEVHKLSAIEPMKCRTIGFPQLLRDRRGYCEEDVQTVHFPESSVGIGLGALGTDFHDCRSRFGEFLAVAGCACYLPTDGSAIPDYLVSAGNFIPEVKVLYGLACDGSFSNLLRFDASPEARSFRLIDVAETCLTAAGADVAAIVILAESAGLVGAALRQPPVAERTSAVDLFSHPEIRNWISFTAEPAYTGSLCVCAGIVVRNPDGALNSICTRDRQARRWALRSFSRGRISLPADSQRRAEFKKYREIALRRP